MQLTRALVTDVDDPDGLGRVRLKLPVGESGWAAVASPAAGEGHGLVLRPAIGDTALVAALDAKEGDLVVIGFLWTGADRPVAGASLRTRGGLSVSLDGSGDRFLLTTSEGARVEIGGSDAVTITATQVTINADMVTASGIVKCDTLITNTVIASTYTPGAGNIL